MCVYYRMNSPFQSYWRLFLRLLPEKASDAGHHCSSHASWSSSRNSLRWHQTLVASVGASLLVITTMTYSLAKGLELELLYNINPCPEWGRRERDLICFPPYAILPLIETFPVGLCFDSETFEKLWLWQSFMFWPRKKLPCVYCSLHLS